MYAELGAALALSGQGNIKVVAVVGDAIHDSIFYHHPAVQNFQTFAEFLDYIEDDNAMKM